MKHLSKMMSLILRHEAERFGLVLDPEGFVSIEELLAAVRRELPDTTRDDISAVVRTIEPDKQRFTIEGDDIRANYGHSMGSRVQHEIASPPAVLFHGTARAALESILASGLKPMRRQYVHLTLEPELARRVGGRHGPPVLLRVHASAASSAGVPFYRANPAFWLADSVPARYLEVTSGGR